MTEPAIDDGYAAGRPGRGPGRAVRTGPAEVDEEARYLPALAEPHPERYSYEAAVNGEYPALCDDPDCQPCEASEAAWASGRGRAGCGVAPGRAGAGRRRAGRGERAGGRAVTAPRRFGPVQLATYLGLEPWQLGRAVADGLIPGPDRSRGRWSAPIADAALAGIGVIRAAAGSIPDLGAVRAAGVLSRRLGLEVTADGVEELARQGLLPVTGYYKQHALYDGRALEAFTGTGAAAEATRAGRLRTADQAAAYLRIRRSDLNHLTRSGVLKPVKYGHGPWDRRNEASVPLYRTGDLDQLTARPGIDWAAVRATPPGRRSPLAAIAEGEAILAALAAPPARRRRPR